MNKTMRIVMTDGRSLMGVFWCTDRDANVILGNCMEYMPPRGQRMGGPKCAVDLSDCSLY